MRLSEEKLDCGLVTDSAFEILAPRSYLGWRGRSGEKVACLIIWEINKDLVHNEKIEKFCIGFFGAKAAPGD